MKRLYVLLSCLVLVFVVQAVSFAENETKSDEVKKPTIACAKCGRVCTCKPLDKEEYAHDIMTPAAYKEYIESIRKSMEEKQKTN
ncbi:hypothetical protein J7L67_07880 [bacterium]|nr:hypothetical protein [bacterium]